MATMLQRPAEPEIEVDPPREQQAARFSADDFLRMEALGAFAGRKLELAHGVIVEERLPGKKHGRLSGRIIQLLGAVTPTTFDVVSELSVRVSDETIRTFDAGVTRIGDEDEPAVEPAAVFLAVEVAVTTLATDLDVKSVEYGAVGIPAYWVVDALAEAVHVMTGPNPAGYSERNLVRFDEALAVPGGGTITIAK